MSHIFDRQQLRIIAALSLPAVITNITTPLLALTDVAIAGHLGDAVFIAAIAVGGTMFSTLFWLFGFLRMGSSGLTAQAVGASDRNEAHAVLARSMLLAVVAGVAIIAVREQLCDALMWMLDVEGRTSQVAACYFRRVIWCAPATLGMFALNGWFVGMQNSRTPMWVSLAVDVLNIGASLGMVFILDMGIEGLATGTLLAQWAGFLLLLLLGVRRYGLVRVPLKNVMAGLSRFFRINTDIFLRTLCLVAVTLWFTRVGAEQGTAMLAVNALLMQMFTLYSYFMDGLGVAAEALCGRHFGAGDAVMLRRAVRSLFGVGALLALLFTLLYITCGDMLLALLSNDPGVVKLAGHYSGCAMAVPVAGFGAFMWDAVFIGLTRTRMMLLSMAVAMAVFFALCGLLVGPYGNHGLWLAFLIYLFTRGLVLTVAYRRRIR